VSGVKTLANPHRIKAAHRRRRKCTVGRFVQRYYDPAIGRFLSVDPVAADSAGGTSFNRYWYANNNPYRFTDPDGRQQQVTPAFFQNLGYPKTMGEAQQSAAQSAAFAESQSPHAVAARLDNLEAGLTATGLGLLATPAAPAAPVFKVASEVVGTISFFTEPTKERGLNVALGGLLKVLGLTFREGTFLKTAVEGTEFGHDVASVADTADKNLNDSSTTSTDQLRPPPPPPPPPPKDPLN
jgi:RHS repeat-associated protein